MQAHNGRLDASATHIWKSLGSLLSISSVAENNYICGHKTGNTQPITEANVNVITQLGHTKKQTTWLCNPALSIQSIKFDWHVDTGGTSHSPALGSEHNQHKGQNDPSRMFVCRGCAEDAERHFISHYPRGKVKTDSSAQLIHVTPLFSSSAERVSRLGPTHNTVTVATTLLSFKVLRLVLCSARDKHQLGEKKRKSKQNRATPRRKCDSVKQKLAECLIFLNCIHTATYETE